MFVPSKYQKAVYTFMRVCHGNAVIDAVAGSGKSTTIVNALKLIPSDKKVLFLAFNKSIVEELKVKVGDMPNVEISTLHSLGLQAIRRASGKIKISGGKYLTYLNDRMEHGSIQSERWEKFTPLQKTTWKQNVRTLLDLVRVNLKSTIADIYELAGKHDIDIIDNEPEAVLDLMDWGKKHVDEIDFCDMIYFPNVMTIRMPQYDWVFIDECQDLNAAQREMFLKCVKPNGRWIAVGDERQAIYGFSGADADSFAKLKAIPNTKKLPLSICYRCDKTIIELAQGIVPQIQYRDNAADGVVKRNCTADDVKDGDMILCRITAPLIKMCMEYIARGRKAQVKGRDIGANLIRIIENTGEKKIAKAIEVLRQELDKIVGKLVGTKIVANEQEAKEHPKYVNALDRIDSIEAISDGMVKSQDVIDKIKSIFADDNFSGIVLSTIHKSKGLENDRVFIIREDKMPLRGCLEIPWMATQEYNLIYVAYTRAKHYLGFIPEAYGTPGCGTSEEIEARRMGNQASTN